MSWLFGKKKQKELPPDSPEEENSTLNQGDQFIFVESQEISVTSSGTTDNGQNPNSPLYPMISSGMLPYPVPLRTDVSKQGQVDVPHYLSGVPFKLCKQLESSMNDDFVIDKIRINEILSFIERIEHQNYDYDFSLENSVISEMSNAE